jgi:uncharacterized phage protein (TIGR01671 family)
LRKLKFCAWNDENICISPDYIDRLGIARWSENSIPTSTKEVEQYIGFNDTDGKEIYEGDIVAVKYVCEDTLITGRIIFENNGASYYVDDDMDLYELDFYEEIKVIGNIHENPELLK